MTGEVSLRGNVLAIGGLKEKTMAAYSAGVRDVLIPTDNMRNLDEVDATVKESLRFIPCKKATDVLKNALCPVMGAGGKATKTVKAAERTEIEILTPAKLPGDTAKIPVTR